MLQILNYLQVDYPNKVQPNEICTNLHKIPIKKCQLNIPKCVFLPFSFQQTEK